VRATSFDIVTATGTIGFAGSIFTGGLLGVNPNGGSVTINAAGAVSIGPSGASTLFSIDTAGAFEIIAGQTAGNGGAVSIAAGNITVSHGIRTFGGGDIASGSTGAGGNGGAVSLTALGGFIQIGRGGASNQSILAERWRFAIGGHRPRRGGRHDHRQRRRPSPSRAASTASAAAPTTAARPAPAASARRYGDGAKRPSHHRRWQLMANRSTVSRVFGSGQQRECRSISVFRQRRQHRRVVFSFGRVRWVPARVAARAAQSRSTPARGPSASVPAGSLC